jgi:SAM-dependent methyltransferase
MRDDSGYIEHLARIAREIAMQAGGELLKHKQPNMNYLGDDIDPETRSEIERVLREPERAARLAPYERAQLKELAFWRWVAFEGYEGTDPRAFPWRQRVFMTTCFMNTGWAFDEVATWDIVEVGCGPLGMIEYLPARRRVACDPLNPHYDRLFRRVRSRGIEYTASLDRLVLTEAGSFDLAISFNVLDHTEKPRDVFDAFMALIRPGGRFLLQVNTVRQGEARPREHKELHPSELAAEQIIAWLDEHSRDYRKTLADKPSPMNEYWFMAWGHKNRH